MKLATLCYVRNQETNKTLMLHRIKKENDMHEGKWNGLGGKLELGESPEECVIREIREEAGLIIKNPKLKGIITFPAFDGFEDWYVFVFTVTEFSSEVLLHQDGIPMLNQSEVPVIGDLPVIDSPEGKLEWIDNEVLTSLNLWDGDKIFLEWLNHNRFFSAKFIYSDGKLLEYSVNFY